MIASGTSSPSVLCSDQYKRMTYIFGVNLSILISHLYEILLM